jgi:putative redox protein
MKKAKARVDWIEKEFFVGTTGKGTKVPMESVPPGMTPRGPTPKELVLHALAGCTLIDVVSIIQKSRKKLEKCWAEVEAEVAEDYPKKYTKIHLIYHFVSSDLDEKTAKRAIELSRAKYCSVTAMLKGSVEMTYEYKIQPARKT